MSNFCQWLIGFALSAVCIFGHPAQLHEKVKGELLSGRFVSVVEGKLVLTSGEYILAEEVKITQVKKLAKPGELKDFSFVEYVGGELTNLPDWYPRDFRVGETSAVGVLSRSRRNPELHFIRANRGIFKLPQEVSGVHQHVELETLPALEKDQKVLVITENVNGKNLANAVCIFPVTSFRKGE